jgi:hypothetical protein
VDKSFSVSYQNLSFGNKIFVSVNKKAKFLLAFCHFTHLNVDKNRVKMSWGTELWVSEIYIKFSS